MILKRSMEISCVYVKRVVVSPLQAMRAHASSSTQSPPYSVSCDALRKAFVGVFGFGAETEGRMFSFVAGSERDAGAVGFEGLFGGCLEWLWMGVSCVFALVVAFEV